MQVQSLQVLLKGFLDGDLINIILKAKYNLNCYIIFSNDERFEKRFMEKGGRFKIYHYLTPLTPGILRC